MHTPRSSPSAPTAAATGTCPGTRSASGLAASASTTEPSTRLQHVLPLRTRQWPCRALREPSLLLPKEEQDSARNPKTEIFQSQHSYPRGHLLPETVAPLPRKS